MEGHLGLVLRDCCAGPFLELNCCTIMLAFNLLLRGVDIEPKDVYLVRHQDTRVPKARKSSPYALWTNDRKNFECYQRLQGEGCFNKRPLLASFVANFR